MLGLAHAKNSGRRTPRRAVIWRAGDGPKPTPEHLTPDEARDQLASLLAHERAKQPAPALRRRGSTPPAPPRTIGEARDEWLRHIAIDRNRRESTVRDYRGQSRRYMVDVFGADTPLEALTTERIEAWQQELIESGRLSRRPIQKAQVMLHAILKRAKKKGWVARNAADADRITLKSSGDFNVLSAEEGDALVRAAADTTEAALYRTALGAGLRMGELRALRWADVDFGRRLILRLGRGVPVGRKRVERLMRHAGLLGLVPRRRGRTTIRVPGVCGADDLVERDFRPRGPNVFWVADITYLRCWKGWLYFAAVQDAYSRGLSAGAWPITCARSSSSTRCKWPSRAGARTPGSSTTPIKAASSSR